ncbi:conserved hypothetical protein [Hyella patelloides LEGE 07179]|uniref:Uncharacterized protein n=1 Tax=Hyella patelloides LEGE 07179 TaxID=945734 RepID=A0A563VWK1_9CYAN|nr:hypothetical protein [Hyella patelloides]VEP15767.1 conserved hypothetical protein [Hyella patelloides LEGE 07179]
MGKNDFFLEPDDAQTMGDIDYMRMAKKVRRTFPKTLKNPNGFAIEKSVSSENDRNFSNANNGFQTKSISNNYQPQSSFNPAPAPRAESTPAPAPKPAPAPAPRKVDDSMDMFRNMAKNIRKGR